VALEEAALGVADVARVAPHEREPVRGRRVVIY
jgi:hypothetical protein